MKKVDPKLLEKFYRSLYRIRRVEEEIIRIYPTDKIKSPVHLSIGQEAISVGVCEALKTDDVVFGTYRGHAMYLAKGGDLKKMIAELYGKVTGCAKGKGGSMHLIDVQKGVMGTSAVVATTIPLSVGYAYSLKYKKSDSVVVSFFGDGAVDEGAFHESMNFAALKRLPVLFVCENNLYAIHSHHLKRHHSDNIAERAKTYGMPAEIIRGGDIFKIYELTKKYVGKMRKGYGPAFLECFTCRWKEHVGPNDDFHLGYRNEEEVQCWKRKDQLARLRKFLAPQVVRSIDSEVEQEIKQAFDFAKKSLFPEPDALYEDVFKEK
ncbi:MAG: thiamine pyrophosphate-dependent dehydrogenase E1 component subunit alpha [Candidatus Omnitrophota bacterium]|nr:thiamine pyrophosphate-dependent dehydrogenase E1 component subunit alpha [Candidatus Omnitrophota bacterium]